MLSILVVLIVVGVCLYLVQTYIPMAQPIKTIITVVVVLALCVWLLSGSFGVIGGADLNLRRPLRQLPQLSAQELEAGQRPARSARTPWRPTRRPAASRCPRAEAQQPQPPSSWAPP